eukprot:1965744-Prymnesium_polylepis.1
MQHVCNTSPTRGRVRPYRLYYNCTPVSCRNFSPPSCAPRSPSTVSPSPNDIHTSSAFTAGTEGEGRNITHP